MPFTNDHGWIVTKGTTKQHQHSKTACLYCRRTKNCIPPFSCIHFWPIWSMTVMLCWTSAMYMYLLLCYYSFSANLPSPRPDPFLSISFLSSRDGRRSGPWVVILPIFQRSTTSSFSARCYERAGRKTKRHDRRTTKVPIHIAMLSTCCLLRVLSTLLHLLGSQRVIMLS